MQEVTGHSQWRAAAAGIYGLVVTASVMATSSEYGTVFQVAISVLVTVLVYWLADAYSEALAHHLLVHGGLTRAAVGALLRERWMLVQASYLPLAVTLVVRVLGASTNTAVNAGLVTATLLLAGLGWLAASRWNAPRAVSVMTALVTGCFGVAMIVLKVLLH